MMLLIIIPLIFLVAFIPRFLVARKIDMTWDEGLYALNGMIALTNIAKLDFSPNAWGFEFHPPFAMYLSGIAYAAYVFVKSLKDRLKLNFEVLYEKAISLFAGRQTLLVMRLPSIFLSSLSCVVVYLLCLDVFNSELVGIIASLLLALTPSFIAWSSLAMLEGGVTFFYVATIWTLFRAIQSTSIYFIILSGILLGLTFGSKETGYILPLTVSPWFMVVLLSELNAGNLSAVTNAIQLLLLWLILGLATFYVSWPWLWRHPVQQFIRSLKAVSGMKSQGGASFAYYLGILLVSTPLSLIFLYCIGIFIGGWLGTLQAGAVLIMSWIIVPLAVMSMPFTPKRGGVYEVTFILPPLSILAGLAVQKLSEVSSEFFGLYPILMTAIFGVGFVFLVLLGCVGVHPCYINYYNRVAIWKDGEQRSLPIGWWGEGMSEAMKYIDQHAPPNSVVWIYGPKSSALYHSKRVNLKTTLGGEPLFYERTKAGFTLPEDDLNYREWRKGDLQLYFPYYQNEDFDSFGLAKLKAENVSFVVVYRWAVHNQEVTGLDDGNYKIVMFLQEHCKPIFTVKIKDMEVCWIYRVKDLSDPRGN